jgi:hypothetical protein
MCQGNMKRLSAGISVHYEICSVRELRTDSQNWDLVNRKHELQTPVDISASVFFCTVQHNFLSKT